MAEIIRLRGSPHDEVQQLLPWFVNGTLDPEEIERVERHLAECGECRGELAAERQLAREIASLPVDVESSWEGMQQRLEAEPGVRAQSATGVWRRRVPLGWAVASPFAAAAAVALVFVNLTPAARQPVDQQYRALGTTGTVQSANLIVQFEPNTRVRDVQAALAAADARLVDGPTETGGYLLRVDQSRRELALKSLRDNDSIALAEPIDGAAHP
jgi:anti-sigma factor RsiW